MSRVGSAIFYVCSCEDFSTYCKEEITDIVGDVDSNAHVCKVESVAQSNQCESDDVVENKFLEVFPALFQ